MAEFLCAFVVYLLLKWSKLAHGADRGDVLSGALATAIGAVIALRFKKFRNLKFLWQWRYLYIFGTVFAVTMFVESVGPARGAGIVRVLSGSWAPALLITLGYALFERLTAEETIPIEVPK